MVVFAPSFLYSQACCTAGTPLLGSLEMTSAPNGVLQIGLSAQHNYLNDVLTGSEFLENQERERVSQSALLEINYGLTKKLSITTLISFIKQSRTITTITNLENNLTATGLGDIVLLSKYSLIEFDIFSRQELSVGLGIKFPTGKASIKNNGILIPADMQPGSGSWDTFFWGYYSKGGFLFSDLILLTNLSFRLNGSNDRFESSKTGYSFGNELITSLGFNFPITAFGDLSLLGKYRNTKQDSFGSDPIPNTGGNWVYIVPGFNFYLTNNLSTSIDAELPVYRNVLGTQLTTTFTASISFFYTINLKEGSF